MFRFTVLSTGFLKKFANGNNSTWNQLDKSFVFVPKRKIFGGNRGLISVSSLPEVCGHSFRMTVSFSQFLSSLSG
jgi:hypothetical protein